MSHMVIYRTADGQPGYHQTDALDEAVSFVEHLRNSDGVDHARIFRMEEVTFDFKPYFKVEVGNEAPMAAAMAPAPAPSPAPEPAAMAAPFSAPAPTPPPVDEHNWMDLPVAEEPVEAPALDPFGAAPEPVAEAGSPFGEPVIAPVPEPATPIFETIPPPPPPPPAMEDDAVGSTNGMGARRGLFGR